MASPKISVNKLGEYLGASPSRRRTIIKDQKNPSTFKAARYKDAREAIVDYAASGMEDEAKAINQIESLLNQDYKSEYEEQDKSLSASSIASFLDLSDEIEIDSDKFDFEAVDKFSTNTTEISGVSVSMRPDLLIKDANDNSVVGALKLHFSKSAPLETEGCKYVATALRKHLEENYPSAKIDNKKCIVVDIPDQNVQSAPKAYKKRMKDIAAACEEISQRWDYI